MYFNSIVFLIFFLPILIIIYGVSDQNLRNLVVLAASVLFFSWNQVLFLPIIGVMIIVNYYLGKVIENAGDQLIKKRFFLLLGCVVNLLLLFFFKSILSYGLGWLPSWLPDGGLKVLNLYLMPLGFSFIVFQLISYLVDVYNGICGSEKSLYNFSIYIMLFPKIMVGPIVRYRDLFAQLVERKSNSKDMADGLRRFIQGLIKKTLIADTIALTINPAFALTNPNYSTSIAWFVLIGYAVQLYFDFSGYTDMAIGLAKIMGFRFVENFNYPYISKSIAEFWRRWHISLSTWFRDYVFHPLEYSRRKFKFMVQPLNILVVFLLTGLWHGITINFIIWGGIHGIALVFESSALGKKLNKLWKPLQHLYTLLVILLGWVFFRSPTFIYAIELLTRLAGSGRGITQLPFSVTKPLPFIDSSVWLALGLGILFSLPVMPWLRKYWERMTGSGLVGNAIGWLGVDLLLIALLILSVAAIVSRATVLTSIYAKF
jgi:alginate O-acetyltransferase complex protein AlgI